MLQLRSGNCAERLVCPREKREIGDGGVPAILGPLSGAVAEKKKAWCAGLIGDHHERLREIDLVSLSGI